ncbi:MAG: hypothetical protein J5J06_04095 [Phycisphaerae bacterium]|nr:hypothetical protein [Phycisphaerae bacterium]
MPNPNVSTCEYEALGRRIAKHVSRPFAPDEYFYYDGNRIVEHYKGSDASLSLHRQYVWGFDYIDELVAYYADGGSTPRFVLQDANYNVIAAAENDSGIIQQYSYEPYGDMFAAEDVLSDSGIPITIPVELPSQAIDLSTPSPASTARCHAARARSRPTHATSSEALREHGHRRGECSSESTLTRAAIFQSRNADMRVGLRS